MLPTWLLVFALHAAPAGATPPPLPTEGPPRIDGLEVTYVTPEAFVGALQPTGANPRATFALLSPRHDCPLTASELAAALDALDGVRAVVDATQVRIDLGDSGLQLATHEIAVGDVMRTIESLGTLVAIPRPIVRMPNGIPVPPPQVANTGYDLVLTNPIPTGEVVVEVQGTRIGTMHPQGVAHLRDVRPGVYEVAFHLDTGHSERLTVSAQPRETEATPAD